MRRNLTVERLIAETMVIVAVSGEIARETLNFALGSAAGAGLQRLCLLVADDAPDPDVDRMHWADVHVLRVILDGDLFSRSRLMNFAVSRIDADWIALLDADVLVNPEFIRAGGQILCANWQALIVPRIYYTQAGEASRIRQGEIVNPGKRVLDGCSQFVWLRKQEFISCGGLDCAFTGWGSEEFEFTWRWEAQGRKIHRPEIPVLHLHHDRGDRKRIGYFKNVQANRELFASFKRGAQIDLPFRVEGVTLRDGGGQQPEKEKPC